MTALDFPSSPSNGDTYGNYIYNSAKGVWRIQPNVPGINSQFYVSETAPADPANGEIWLNSADGSTYIYYVDGDSSQWIEIGGNTGQSPTLDALNNVTITSPTDGQALVYDNATSSWINGDTAGGVEIASTAPSSPSAGDLWWDSDNGNLYVYYDDGTSQQWVSASDGQATISDTAPTGYNGQLWWNSTEGKMYVYYDDGTSAQWVAAGGPQVTVQATAPTGYQGQMWLDSTDGSMYVYYTDPGGASSSWIGAVSRSGGILQVVSTTKTDAFSTTSTSYTDITGLSATITPRSTSSKILVLYSVFLGESLTSFANVKLLRGSTDIAIGDAIGSLDRITLSSWTAGGENHMTVSGGNFLDSPSTTSSTTYKFQIKSAGSSSAVYVNRNRRNSSAGADPSAISTITLIEVAG
jgi:hypothetical protein